MEKSKFKLLQIFNSFPGETFLQEHAHVVSKSTKIDLYLAYLETSGIGSLKYTLSSTKKVFSIPNYNRLSKPLKMYFMLKNLSTNSLKVRRKIALDSIKKINPDLIHFQFASTAVAWSWLAEDLNIPFTFSLRGSDINVQPLLIKGYKHKLIDISGKAFKIHAVSNSIKIAFEELINFKNPKIKVIRTSTSDVWSKLIMKPQKGNILSVGRLHWIKGHRDLILACKYLKEKKYDFTLYIIGEGKERNVLEFMIRDLELTDNVKLLGKKEHNQIMEYISKSDIMVQSSLNEGFPNTLAEAMSSGLAIVSNDCGGINEILKDGQNAFISLTGDPKDLSKKLAEALENDHRRAEMLLAAKNDSQKYFSSETHLKNFEAFWLNEN